MKNFLGLLLLFSFCNLSAQDCTLGDADFTYTFADDCTVIFSPCNSGGFGTWDFGDGETAYTQGVVHCYPGPDSYYVIHEFMGETVGKFVTVNCETEDPVISIESQEGCCVTFGVEVACYDEGSVTWNFGDGSTLETGSDIIVEHCYDEEDTYEVGVISQNGSSSTEVEIIGCDPDCDFALVLDCDNLQGGGGHPSKKERTKALCLVCYKLTGGSAANPPDDNFWIIYIHDGPSPSDPIIHSETYEDVMDISIGMPPGRLLRVVVAIDEPGCSSEEIVLMESVVCGG